MQKARLNFIQKEIAQAEDLRKSYEWAVGHIEDEEIQQLYSALILETTQYASDLRSKAFQIRKQLYAEDTRKTAVRTPSFTWIELLSMRWLGI